MKFNYYPLNENLKEKVSLNNETIYIFNNFYDRDIFEKEYQKNLLEENPIFFTWKEFKENILLTDRFTIKEEKRTLLLYKSLTEDLKEKLKIKNYYDFIDYGENFLKFYKELYSYKINDLGKLEPWQKKSYDIMKEIYFNFEKLLKENNYIVPEFMENLEYIDINAFNKYKNINFINVFDFTPFEKDILIKLDNKFHMEFYLNMNHSSYDEKKLKFLNFNLEKNTEISFEVYEVKDNFETLINVVNDAYIDNTFKIYSCDFDNLNYRNLVSENFIKKNKKSLFEESKLYNFLELINEFLLSKTIINGEKFYKLGTYILLLENKEFCKYFSIGEFHKNFIFKSFVKEEYKYINYRIIFENNKNNIDITCFEENFNFVDKIFELKTLSEFVSFLGNEEKFDYKKFIQEKYVDLFAKYFEALTEIESNEMLKIKFEWSDFFNKTSISESLFKLILKYLKHKSIEEVNGIEKPVLIYDFKETKSLDREKGIIIDISNETYPEKSKGSFLLSNKQRKNLGLKSYEEEKELLRYHFFQRIATMEKVIIYSVKNPEFNIDSSGFVDELLFFIKQSPKKPKFSQNDLSAFVKELFEANKILESYSFEKDYLPKDVKDLGEKFYFGAYDFSDSKTCLYKFYLKKIKGIERVKRNIDYDFENRTMGIIVHSLFEDIFRYYHQEFLLGNFFVSKEKIESIFEKIIKREIYKIPQELKLYLKEIIMPIYVNSAYNFFWNIKNVLKNEKIQSFQEEKNAKKDIITEPTVLGIKGRGDLIIEAIPNNYIVDIKTGGENSEQLAFYERLFFDEKDSTKKYVYNAWEDRLKENEAILSLEELTTDLKNFLSKDKFERAEKKSFCVKCDYKDICRMRWENE